MSLTRSDLESRRLQGLISEFTKLGLHVLSEAELQECLAARQKLQL